MKNDEKIEYDVRITETLARNIKIHASSIDDAIETAKRLYYGQEIILDSGDFVEVDFSIPGGSVC